MHTLKKITLLITTVIIAASCETDENKASDEYLLNSTYYQTNDILTSDEENDLLFSREEEKLARDVYINSYNKYGLSIFNNISSSEQKHMDSVLKALINYGLEDPASATIGVFSNQTLQNLYNELVEKSNTSLTDALIVGCFIEDLDIKDLDDLISRTDENMIINTYESLKCGSRNHLRSFINQLDSINVNYEPQYISLEDFNAIINSDLEHCGNN
ncbi:MAG: DUF2202 domain-containing protein [Lutibacter sp.]|uniref:DUF2202 domain-containing protein n=1 Tax=Lutibacter sp. TaxID=1925666 RepID=UPI00299E5E5C|nr:DUF2202 domain-containing protein [Lutibacter sp.]MDX1828043.1 DUF2202 domain-containing protein [Lutibacter sp.]